MVAAVSASCGQSPRGKFAHRGGAEACPCSGGKKIMYATRPAESIVFGKLGLFRGERISARMNLQILNATIEPPFAPWPAGMVGSKYGLTVAWHCVLKNRSQGL